MRLRLVLQERLVPVELACFSVVEEGQVEGLVLLREFLILLRELFNLRGSLIEECLHVTEGLECGRVFRLLDDLDFGRKVRFYILRELFADFVLERFRIVFRDERLNVVRYECAHRGKLLPALHVLRNRCGSGFE